MTALLEHGSLPKALPSRQTFQPQASFEDWKQQTVREFLIDQLAILERECGIAKRVINLRPFAPDPRSMFRDVERNYTAKESDSHA